MNNALEYVFWRGDLPVETDPVNEVDLFLCSQLSTPDFKGCLGKNEEKTLKEAARQYFAEHTMDVKNLGLLQSKYVLPMLEAMAGCRRFEDSLLINAETKVDPENMEQFQAVTVRLSKDLLVISVRGTDDTLVGWKEDCYLAVEDEVPAQKDALDYFVSIARKYPEDSLCIVGHSKGGNLAIYAAVNAPAEIQDRLVWAVGYDCPGFTEKVLLSDRYLRVADRIITVVSQNSIVGMLMMPAGRYALVHSQVAGPMAHDGFRWEVRGTRFIRDKELSAFSASFSAAFYATLESLSKEQMKKFVDEVFEILEFTGAQTVTELAEQKLLYRAGTVARLVRNPVVREFLGKLVSEMERAGKNLPEVRKLISESYISADETMG